MFGFPEIIGPNAESPLAVTLERALVLHIAEEVTLIREFECETPWAKFRIDLVADTPTGRIGFECDGKEFHDNYRDEVRDSLILGCNCVETIYRLPGAQVNFALHDSLYLIGLYDPHLFTERGRAVLATQACDGVKDHSPDGYGGSIIESRVNRGDPPDRLEPYRCHLKRQSRRIPAGRRPFWTEIYADALSHQHLSFSQYMEANLARITSSF